LLIASNFHLPPRAFSVLRHKERHQSKAAAMLEKFSRDAGAVG